MMNWKIWQLVVLGDACGFSDCPWNGDKHEQWARWPGSLLIGVLKTRGKDKIQSYKGRLLKGKVSAPQSDPPSYLSQQFSRWHGHVTLWLLVGTLINVVSKLYMSHRYEDVQRLQFQKFQSREIATHWQKIIWVVEKEHAFWRKIENEARRRGHRCRAVKASYQEVYFQHQYNISAINLGDTSGHRSKWLGYLLSLYQKVQKRSLACKSHQMLDACSMFEAWAANWEQLEAIGKAEMCRSEKVKEDSFLSFVTCAGAALLWNETNSRELFFQCQIPFTNLSVKLWTASQAALEGVP